MKTPQIEVSVCCKAGVVEDSKTDPRDHHNSIPICTCSKCKQECQVENVCEYCRGDGEVSVDETDGEGHMMSGVGTEKCECRLDEGTED